MTTAAEIALEYVFPILGILVGNYMFYAPYKDVQKAIARGALLDLNPLPWAFMLGNCAAWVLYSILTRNFFVFVGNLPGFFLATWFNLAASKLRYREQFTMTAPAPAPAPVTSPKQYSAPNHDYWVMATVAAWMAIVSVVGFGDDITADSKQLIVGVCANLNLSFFYGAPLSTIFKVIREQNTATIHVLTMITNTANGIFWGVYGLAVMDYYIFVPNGLGAFLGFIQLALCMVLPRIETQEQVATTCQDEKSEGKPSTYDDEESPVSDPTTRIPVVDQTANTKSEQEETHGIEVTTTR